MGERLAGKIAIITGAGSGIGRATAVQFAAQGATVMVNDIDGDAAQKTVDIIGRTGARVKGHVADVTEEREVGALVADAVRSFGRVDILFNNAGGAIPTPSHLQDSEDYHRIVALNQHAVYYGTMAVLPLMTEQRGGCILTTSSGAGLAAVPGLAIYGAAKAAVINLARGIAIEYGHLGIRANVIAPGAMYTPGMAAWLETQAGGIEEYARQIPTGRLGRAEDIARAAVFLASDEADYINGAVLPVDGGTHARLAAPQFRDLEP